MAKETLPEHLVIIGGSYIAVEFATTYAQFGAKVTLLVRDDRLLPQVESEAVTAVTESLTDLGVEIRYQTQVVEMTDEGDHTVLSLVANAHR